MNPDRLLEHFERISEAPNAISRLRRFILDLVVRGKLVEQDAKDEPVVVLLKRIERETERLIKAGEIRKQDLLPPIAVDEVPFAVPKGWALVRLGQALHLINGRAFKPSEWTKTGLPIIRIQNLNNVDAPFNYCDAPMPAKVHIKAGDFLISWSGTPGTSFGAHIWDRGPAILNQHIFKAELVGDAFAPPFLKLAINSRLLELIEQAHGGVGLQHITKPKLEKLPLTLPPLAEQHRIVAKVDELMALCDRLEAAQTDRESRRERLVAASLQRLSQPVDANDASAFREHTRFHLRHLSRLTTRPEQIKQLRQTILDLAVRGKLVEQDPNDESASELLKLPGNGSSKILSELPSQWGEAKVGQLLDFRYGKPFPATERLEKGRVSVFGSNGVVGYGTESLTEDSAVIIGRKGSAGALNLCAGPSWTTDVAYFVLPPAFFNIRFLFIALQTLDLDKLGKGVKPGLSRNDAYQLSIMVPPLAEQYRIVAKVDELMALCDRLEAQLTTTQTESHRLLESVLHHAFKGEL